MMVAETDLRKMWTEYPDDLAPWTKEWQQQRACKIIIKSVSFHSHTPHHYHKTIYLMYAMFFKFAVLFSLVAIQVPTVLEGLHRTFSSAQGQTPMNLAEENRFLRQELVTLQSELIIERILTKCRSPGEAIKEVTDRNVRLYREVVGLQDALKATKLGILRGGISDGVLPLVDKIQRKVEILQVSRMWRDEWAQGELYSSVYPRWVAVLTILNPQIPHFFPTNS